MKSANFLLTKVISNTKLEFTARYKETEKAIILPSHVSLPTKKSKIDVEGILVNCLWDTGASECCIMLSSAISLGLVSDVELMNDTWQAKTVTVNLHLLKLLVIQIEVGIAQNCPGFDMIIGMNIINKGILRIMNSVGKSVVQFEMPVIIKNLKPNNRFPDLVSVDENTNSVMINYPGIVDRIITDCLVSPKDRSESITVRGIWDSGSPISFISKSLANKMQRPPISNRKVFDYKGSYISNIYLVNIRLINGMEMEASVGEFNGDRSDYDVMIGMDLICKGNLLIDNSKGKTLFSFESTK